MTKRYYWLRLKDGFFDSKRIKRLRRMSDTYVIIYLKLQLKAMKTEGVIRYTGLEDSAAEEFALDINEDPLDVEETLNYLLEKDLCESDGTNFFFPYALENTGSETASAKRWRDWRDRHALDSNAEQTDCKQNANGEKEIEIEKEIEKDSFRYIAPQKNPLSTEFSTEFSTKESLHVFREHL